MKLKTTGKDLESFLARLFVTFNDFSDRQSLQKEDTFKWKWKNN